MAPRKKPGPKPGSIPKDKHTGGRPAHVPTEDLRVIVEAGIARGTPLRNLARALGIQVRTLHKHYAKIIEIGATLKAEKTEASIRDRAYGHTGPDRRYYPPSESLLRLLGERDLGWTEKSTHVMTGPGGGPVEVATKTREEQVAKFKRLLEPQETPGGQKPPAAGS